MITKQETTIKQNDEQTLRTKTKRHRDHKHVTFLIHGESPQGLTEVITLGSNQSGRSLRPSQSTTPGTRTDDGLRNPSDLTTDSITHPSGRRTQVFLSSNLDSPDCTSNLGTFGRTVTLSYPTRITTPVTISKHD